MQRKFRDGAIRVNLWVSGTFELPLPGPKTANVSVTTGWPAAAVGTSDVEGIPARLRHRGLTRDLAEVKMIANPSVVSNEARIEINVGQDPQLAAEFEVQAEK